VAIVLNALLDWAFFGESLGALEVTTFLTIFAAIFLFTILGAEWDAVSSSEEGDGHRNARRRVEEEEEEEEEEEGSDDEEDGCMRRGRRCLHQFARRQPHPFSLLCLPTLMFMIRVFHSFESGRDVCFCPVKSVVKLKAASLKKSTLLFPVNRFAAINFVWCHN
jgi:hypothetical protein